MIGGIIRVSTDSAEQAQSPANQRAHLASAGCTAFYEDKISGSAKGGEKRRQSAVWQQLEADIKNRKLSKLLVCEVNRIARRDHLVMGLVELCDEYGVDFLATTGGTLTAKSAPQWLSVKQQAVFAEYFAREQSDKIKRGQAAAVSRGVFGFTSRHLAWHLLKDPEDPRKIIKHPDHWDTAREIAIAYIEGRISAVDAARTIYSRHGVLRQASGVSKWLRSYWIRGHYGKRGGEVLIANVAPALITEEEYLMLQKRLAGNAKSKGTRAPHKKRALTGVCECAWCGGGLSYRVANGSKYLFCGKPDCTNYSKLMREDMIEEQLREYLHDLDLVEFEQNSRSASTAAKPTKELLNLKLRVKKLDEALAIVDSPGVRADYEQAIARINELEAAQMPAESEMLTSEDLKQLGSAEWWSKRDDHQRNTDYLYLFELVGVNIKCKSVQYVKTIYCDWSDMDEED